MTIAATVAASALATPRVLLYSTGDTPHLRAAQAGVREALGAMAIEEISVADAGVRLKAAAHEGNDVALITLGPHAAARARMSGAADALLAMPDTTVFTSETAKALLLFSFRHKLPLIGLSETWVQAGALFALDWDYRELGMFCGRLALQRLAGGNAAAPSPPRLHVVVNQRSARLFGLRWDDALRRSFDRVVE